MTSLVSKHKSALKWILGFFLMWRGVLFLVSYLATRVLEYKPTFPYYQSLADFNLPQWLYSWANFDGVHYLTIADKGYIGTGLIQAFFPLYPLTTGFLSQLLAFSPLVIGLLISNLFALCLLVVWYFFVKDVWTEKIARLSSLILFLFPTSFFLGAVYSESLFLSLVIGTFWAAHRKKWWLAGLLAALASATRVIGVLLIPALIIELISQQPGYNLRRFLQTFVQVFRTKPRELAWIVFGGLGFALYSFFLYQEFSDPLYFFHVQAEFGGVRQESLVLYPQVVWRYIKIFQTLGSTSWDRIYTLVQEFLAGTVVIVTLIASRKYIRLSHLTFAVVAFFIPTLTGTFSSMSRYTLSLFPLFIVSAIYFDQQPKYKWLYFIGSLFLLICNTILFIQGYWVA